MSEAFHAGLRKEAHDWLTGKMHRNRPSERYVRAQREKCRAAGDQEAYTMWTRLLWRLYTQFKYREQTAAPRRLPKQKRRVIRLTEVA